MRGRAARALLGCLARSGLLAVSPARARRARCRHRVWVSAGSAASKVRGGSELADAHAREKGTGFDQVHQPGFGEQGADQAMARAKGSCYVRWVMALDPAGPELCGPPQQVYQCRGVSGFRRPKDDRGDASSGMVRTVGSAVARHRYGKARAAVPGRSKVWIDLCEG